MADPFVRKIHETISKFKMIREKETILVGVSGGPDSIALVRILMDLEKTIGISGLGIAHLNHSLRGKESLRDENFVRAFAQNFDLPFFLKKIDIKPWPGKNASL